MKTEDIKVYQVLKCSEPVDTKPTTADTEVQKYVVVEIVEVNTNTALAQFSNLIITSKPFRIVMFEDQGSTFDKVQMKDAEGKADAHIPGRIYTRKTKPYYVIDAKSGKPYTYKKGELKGLPVVATSVKFFVYHDQEEEIEFEKVMRNNASTFVPINELSPYVNILGLSKQDLKDLGVDVDAQQEQTNKDADLLAGDTAATAEPPADPPAATEPPAATTP